MDSLLCHVGGVLGKPSGEEQDAGRCVLEVLRGMTDPTQMTRAPESVAWVKQRQVRRRSLKSEPTI